MFKKKLAAFNILETMQGIESKLIGNVDFQKFLMIYLESIQEVKKLKVLVKSRIDKEKQDLEKFINQVKFNKYELVFILDNNKNKKVFKSISIKVENDMNKEFFLLNDNHIICKLYFFNLENC